MSPRSLVPRARVPASAAIVGCVRFAAPHRVRLAAAASASAISNGWQQIDLVACIVASARGELTRIDQHTSSVGTAAVAAASVGAERRAWARPAVFLHQLPCKACKELINLLMGRRVQPVVLRGRWHMRKVQDEAAAEDLKRMARSPCSFR